ncbi:MAG: DUF4192 family protein, partial [Actinomycetes bacterium]
MTAPERLTVRAPEDILGYIPHSLGYWPASSLVAMTLHGTRLGATLRLDLPGPETGTDSATYARAVRRYLESDQEADGALLAVFTTDAAIIPPLPCGHLLAAVQKALDQAGMPVRSAWLVGGKYWRDASCTDAGCCPFPGRPVQEIKDSMLNAEMVYRGSSVGPAPGTGSAPAPAVPGTHLAAVLEAQDGWEEKLAGQSRSRAGFNSVLDFWEVLLAGSAAWPWTPDAGRDAFLRATLLCPTWRDAVMVMAAAGRDAAEAGAEQFGVLDDDGADAAGMPLGQLPLLPPPLAPAGQRRATRATGTATGKSTSAAVRKLHPERRRNQDAAQGGGQGGTRRAGQGSGQRPDRHIRRLRGRTPAGYGEVMMGVAPDVPDWAGLDNLDRILAELAVPGGPAAAAPLTLRGWVAWCRGRGSYAADYFRQALEADPEYR